MKIQAEMPENVQDWLQYASKLRKDLSLSTLEAVVSLYTPSTQTQTDPLLKKALNIAEIILAMGLDSEALIAALVYPLLQQAHVEPSQLTESFGESCTQLMLDLLQMQAIEKLEFSEKTIMHQAENVRNMLLAMVSDIRSVFIILAERLWQLRQAKNEDELYQKKLAEGTQRLFTPLANRLGLAQLKWEMEDLCLRYLEPKIYHEIAKGLALRRVEREENLQLMREALLQQLAAAGLNQVELSGRTKHIYSIYKKMQRKSITLDQVYDMNALRIIVADVKECYAVLSVLQNHWQEVHEEFDDYIMHPKANGYRSIHTVLLGVNNHLFEVQIRTQQMHREAELGVAAHWRYKEGILQTAGYETKFNLLRQIIAWQKEMTEPLAHECKPALTDLFANRTYVFTPTNEIIDLPLGATPLDFAYHIHSEVGHRCRGAKVNGHIVPLTHILQTGDRIEILTAKEAKPSRDWMNPQRGYLKSPRARAKVQQWFKLVDHITLPQLAAPPPSAVPVAKSTATLRTSEPRGMSQIHISGVDQVLTHVARCCKPLPGDQVIGYITRNRGVSVHRADCRNITMMQTQHATRLIDVSWNEKIEQSYPVDLHLQVKYYPKLLSDLTTLLAKEKIVVIAVQLQAKDMSEEADVFIALAVSSMPQLQEVLSILKAMPWVLNVKRR